MPRVRLTGGAYPARSIIASEQRQVNLFAEVSPPGAILGADGNPPLQAEQGIETLYPTPGLTTLATPTSSAARGLFWASTDVLFYCVGASLYSVSSAWALTLVGTIAFNTTPVSMADNGITMVLVDGTSAGYQVVLATMAFSAINGAPTPAGNAPTIASTAVYAFYGADRVAAMDGYLLFNQPATANFYTTYNGQVVFDATYIAAKNGFPDHLVAVVVLQRLMWLIGERTTEIWFDAGSQAFTVGGNPLFPFAIMSGPFLQHGCSAKYSIAQMGESIYWLSQDQTGGAILLRTQGYLAQRISTHAIETMWASYPTTADAVAFVFQQNGHSFYQINFPTADRSWRYDDATHEWHEVAWTDGNGVFHQHRASCAAYAYGKVVAGDFQTGVLYQIDPANFTDAGAPIVRRRDFPHIVNDGDRVTYQSLILDMSVGNSVGTVDPPGNFPALTGDTSPQVLLSWSDDRGRTFSNPIKGSAGATGEYLTSMQYQRLGMARDRVFRVQWSAPIDTALQGAWLTFTKAST